MNKYFIDFLDELGHSEQYIFKMMENDPEAPPPYGKFHFCQAQFQLAIATAIELS